MDTNLPVKFFYFFLFFNCLHLIEKVKDKTLFYALLPVSKFGFVSI